MAARSRRQVAVALVMAAAGCSSGDGAGPNPPPPPPPAPVVAAVEVTPPTGSVAAGDSLRLTATPKTAAGAAVTGKTITWTTSAAAIATVSATGIVNAIAQGAATITATVDGQGGTAAIQVTKGQMIVTLDGGRSVSDSIGPAGGKLEVTSTAGLKYTLEIPAAALAKGTRITMTPIARIAQLPLTGGLVGGADFQPSGLEFAVPAKLVIATTATQGPGLNLMGFTYQAAGDSLALVGVKAGATSLTLSVRHFSGVGAGFGTTLDLQNLAGAFVTPAPFSPSQTWINYLLQLAAQTPRDFQAEFAAMRAWFNQTLLPQLQNAVQDFQLLRAIGEYNFWLQTTVALNTSGGDLLFADVHQAWAQAVKPKLQGAMTGNDQECLNNRSYTAAANVLFWQAQGETFGVFTALDRVLLLANLCLKVILTDTTYPNPATPGASHNLDLRAGVKFGANAALDNGPFNFTLTPSGATNNTPVIGLSDALGKFTRVISPTGLAVFTVQVKACLHHPQVPYSDICTDYRLQRLFGRTIQGAISVLSLAGLQALSDVGKVEGSLTISNVPSVDLAELPMLTEVTGPLTLIGMPALASLNGLRNLERVQSLMVWNNPQLTSLLGLANLRSMEQLWLVNNPLITRPVVPLQVTEIPGALHISSATVDNLDGLFGLTRIGTLMLTGVRATSLSPLRNTQVEGLWLQGTQVTSLTGLNLPNVVNQLALMGNTALTDISAASGVTRVIGGDVFILGNAVTSLSALSNLRVIDQRLILGPGTASSAYTLTGLTDVGSLSFQGSSVPCGGGSFTIRIPGVSRVNSIGSHGAIGASPCPMILELANISSTRSLMFNGAGFQRITVGRVDAPPLVNQCQCITIGGSLNLVSLTIGGIDIAGDLTISGNPLLTSVSIGGRVGKNMKVENNALLSTQAIKSWPVTVAGTKTIQRNGQP